MFFLVYIADDVVSILLSIDSHLVNMLRRGQIESGVLSEVVQIGAELTKFRCGGGRGSSVVHTSRPRQLLEANIHRAHLIPLRRN